MPSDAVPVVRLERLSKRYGHVTVLDEVSFDVRRGEIFGFLGLNGAGKTTTIRILLDLVRPTSGRAFVFGKDCRADGLAVRARIGYLPGEIGFYGDMTGLEMLELLGRLGGHPIDPRWRQALVDRLAFATGDLRRKIREYSSGMKRKLGIIQAFQTEAPLLILDEPTDGLDPLMQDAVYDLLADMRRRGRTVFMSSHVLPEVERVCDRIGLLRRGILVLVSTVDEVRRMAARTVRVTFTTEVAAPSDGWPGECEAIELTPQSWRLRVSGPLGPLMAIIGRMPIDDLHVHEPHLEDVLRRYYREDRVR